jgi:hypothetical protein
LDGQLKNARAALYGMPWRFEVSAATQFESDRLKYAYSIVGALIVSVNGDFSARFPLKSMNR